MAPVASVAIFAVDWILWRLVLVWCLAVAFGVVFFSFFLTFLFVGDGGLLDFVFYWCGSSGFVFVGEWDVGPSIFRFHVLFVFLFFLGI